MCGCEIDFRKVGMFFNSSMRCRADTFVIWKLSLSTEWRKKLPFWGNLLISVSDQHQFSHEKSLHCIFFNFPLDIESLTKPFPKKNQRRVVLTITLLASVAWITTVEYTECYKSFSYWETNESSTVPLLSLWAFKFAAFTLCLKNIQFWWLQFWQTELEIYAESNLLMDAKKSDPLFRSNSHFNLPDVHIVFVTEVYHS